MCGRSLSFLPLPSNPVVYGRGKTERVSVCWKRGRKMEWVRKTHRFFDSILIIAHNECGKVIELFIVWVRERACVCVHWIGVVHLWRYSTEAHAILVANALKIQWQWNICHRRQNDDTVSYNNHFISIVAEQTIIIGACSYPQYRSIQ